MPAREATILLSSIARARIVHTGILLGSWILILLIAARSFENSRELERLWDDRTSLQTVLNQANSVIEELNAYLLDDFKRRTDLKFEVKPALAQLLLDSIAANKLYERASTRLANDRRLTNEQLAAVNLPLVPMRDALRHLRLSALISATPRWNRASCVTLH